MGHVRSLDGLRGIAVLAVVIYHFAPAMAPGGFLGVDVFFVLSGFLITSLLIAGWENNFRISLPAFWARRARRLLPALVLVLAACGIWVVAVAPQIQGQHVANDALAALSYVANWHFIASSQSYLAQFANHGPTPLQHTWSLAIEEQFYFVWPLLVAAVGAIALRRAGRSRRRRRVFRRALIVVSLTLAAMSLIRMWSLYHPGTDPSRVYYGTDTHAAVILFGAALAALTTGAPVVRGAGRVLAVVLGLLAATTLAGAFVMASAADPWLYEGGYALVGLVIICVLVAGVQPGFNPLRKLLETRSLVGLGLISYGVYLWHWPFVVWLTPASVGVSGAALFAVRAVATLTVSIPSYYLVERPIRQRRLPSLPRSIPGLVPLGLVTLVAVLLIVPSMTFPAVASAPTSVATSQGARAVTLSYATAPRCDTKPNPPVTLGTTSHPFRVQLVGNSFAGELQTCLGTILHARGGQLLSVIGGGNPLCYRRQSIRAQLRNPKTRPAVAVLFQSPLLNLQAPPCPDSQSFEQHLSQALRDWRAAGVHVVLVPDVAMVGSSGALDETTAVYAAVAARDPGNVSVVDTGIFIRDGSGRSQWRMPCVAHEIGCGPDRTVGVRWPTDRTHFCSDPDWITHHQMCAPEFAGGERRISAAVAATLLTLHTAPRGAS
jgi:peptidoglycan/LPS O-acetylase OafA/YrhL